MKFYAAVVNAYGKVGQEFVDFASVIYNTTRGKGRGKNLICLLSMLGVYANAEKVLLAHAPSSKRAQRGDVLAAIAAKDGEAVAAVPQVANRATVRQKKERSKTQKCPQFRGVIIVKNGQKWICCTGCNPHTEVSYAGWSQHCLKHHPDVDPKTRDDHDASATASTDGKKDKDGGEPKKRLVNDQGVQEARILQPKPWRMPTRFNLQKAIEEQKMRKAIAAGLCKCPIETHKVRKAIATGQFDLNTLKMKSKQE